ncbi:hypothetical protein V8C34DRAFT_287452 [Trichoderma compactum]
MVFFSSIWDTGGGLPGSCLLKTNLFTRERRRNMICYISCDTGDTAYAITLRIAFYTQKDAERLLISRQASTEGEAQTCLGQAASSLDGRCLDCASEALGYLDAMHSSPSRGEARRGEAVCIKTQQRIV